MSEQATLAWEWDSESDSLQASSQYMHDQGSQLKYCVERISETSWSASFEGCEIASGLLLDCLVACEHSETQERPSL